MIKRIIADGYSASAGLCDKGWYGAVLLLKDSDEDFIEEIIENNVKKYRLKEGCSFEDWMENSAFQKRRLLLLEDAFGELTESELASADRIFGPCIPKGIHKAPVVVWSQKINDTWKLCIKKGLAVSTVVESPGMLRTPSAAAFRGEYYIALLADMEDGTRTRVYKEDGSIYFETPGRRPVLCAAGSSLYLICENPEPDRSEISLMLFDISDTDNIKKWRLSVDDINIQADMEYDPESGLLYIAWESMVTWGVDHCIGRHKGLNVWYMESGKDPVPLKGESAINLPREAFGDGLDGLKSNITNCCPKLIMVQGSPALLFKRFTIHQYKINGWDVCWTRWDGEKWLPYERLSENFGMPDTDYSVLEYNGLMYGIFPCCEFKSWNKSINHRAEICVFKADETLPAKKMPLSIRSTYDLPYSVKGAGAEPDEIDTGKNRYKLVWGDMHVHTSYSKCMSSIDGSIDENLRYYRDVLGCRVLTVTDHFRLISIPEYIWIMDKLEENSDRDCVIIYGGEPNVLPDHHTNLYAIDRSIYDIARNITHLHLMRGDWYRALKERLPGKSVAALRHLHGGGGPEGIESKKTLETWDPELEPAMEAMQGRGNAMISTHSGRKIPLFPSNFLNANAKVGLVAGTDHSLDTSINYVCLTGFWVKELTAEAVWEAINERRTIAASNGKAAVWTELEGKPMGSDVEVKGDVKINVKINSPYGILRICLIRDGSPLEWINVKADSFDGILEDKNPEPGYHWYSVTAECGSVYSEPAPFRPINYFSERNRSNNLLVHASPYFVTVKG